MTHALRQHAKCFRVHEHGLEHIYVSIARLVLAQLLAGLLEMLDALRQEQCAETERKM